MGGGGEIKQLEAGSGPSAWWLQEGCTFGPCCRVAFLLNVGGLGAEICTTEKKGKGK